LLTWLISVLGNRLYGLHFANTTPSDGVTCERRRPSTANQRGFC
ncbi:TRAP transporter, 4TM/12TM fusion family protein, partial [Vibrio parahaemolyticus AQ3810]